MILEVKDLHVHYGRIGHLANLSFAVDAGEILCIRCPVLQFGTVLLWALIGAGERIEGRIRFDGENLAGPLSPAKLLALREHIAMVYRERGLISLLTVEENIALPLGYHYNVDRRKLADAVHDVADALRISTLLDRDAEDIREMDTRLVNLARALIRRPRLILIDGLLEGAQPTGYAVQSRSHNAVAAAVVQGRADWGVAIETVARPYGLSATPIQDEHYDFAVPKSRFDRPAVQAFRSLLTEPDVRQHLADFGFRL